ncbi:hypothetical protein [Roseovarius nubinhibens]|uniref:hypothetical protein n=1 Tax=Roseovarius nubinhibens TaxID=314263 RepID=UPI001C089C4A|nr:hypothetical protein [Roseovarius nubinhibens]
MPEAAGWAGNLAGPSIELCSQDLELQLGGAVTIQLPAAFDLAVSPNELRGRAFIELPPLAIARFCREPLEPRVITQDAGLLRG